MQVLDRLSFMRFLDIGIGDSVPDAQMPRCPDANTVWIFKEALKKHGLTRDLFDQFEQFLREQGRSALHSIIPVDTGLTKGIGRILPKMSGRFQCLYLRVPTLNVSAMDLSVNLILLRHMIDEFRLVLNINLLK